MTRTAQAVGEHRCDLSQKTRTHTIIAQRSRRTVSVASARLRRRNKFNPDLIVTSPHDIAVLTRLVEPRQRQKKSVRQTFDIVNGKPRATVGHIDYGASLQTRIVPDIDPRRRIELLPRPEAFVIAHCNPPSSTVQLIDHANDSLDMEPKMFSLVQTQMAYIDSNYPDAPRFGCKVRRYRPFFRENDQSSAPVFANGGKGHS
jgi:hypothetical protein